MRAALLVLAIAACKGSPAAAPPTNTTAPATASVLDIDGQVYRYSCDFGKTREKPLHIPAGARVRLHMKNISPEDFEIALDGKRTAVPQGGQAVIELNIATPGEVAWDCPVVTDPKWGTTPIIVDTRADYDAWVKSLGPTIAKGQDVFNKKGCIACHSIDGSQLIGATMKGLWGSTVTLENGTTHVVDKEFFEGALNKPLDYVQAGFPTTMPSFEGQLRDHEIAALELYVESLK